MATGRGDANDMEVLTIGKTRERVGVNFFSPFGKRGEMFIFGTWSLWCAWNIQVEMSV